MQRAHDVDAPERRSCATRSTQLSQAMNGRGHMSRLTVLVLLAAALLSGCARPPVAPVGSSTPSVAASSSVGSASGSVPGTVSVPAGQGRITVGALDLAFSASAQAPAQPPRLAPRHRWLATVIVATNSTDATVDVPTHQNDPVLTDSTGTTVVPYTTTALVAPSWAPDGLGPGGVLRYSGWYQVPLDSGPFSVTWTAGSGQLVVFHAP